MLKRNKILISVVLIFVVIVLFYTIDYSKSNEQPVAITGVVPIKLITTITTTSTVAIITTTSTSMIETTSSTTLRVVTTTNSISTSTTTSLSLMPHKKAASTPIENLPTKKETDKGRYFINQSITFDRRLVSGQIPGQMLEIQSDYLLDYIAHTNETIYNIYLFYWNGSVKDVIGNYYQFIKSK